jgi:hypothetical protein
VWQHDRGRTDNSDRHMCWGFTGEYLSLLMSEIKAPLVSPDKVTKKRFWQFQ